MFSPNGPLGADVGPKQKFEEFEKTQISTPHLENTPFVCLRSSSNVFPKVLWKILEAFWRTIAGFCVSRLMTLSVMRDETGAGTKMTVAYLWV